MNILKYTAYVLVLIGALNWGLIGLFSFDLVAAIFGDMTLLTRIIYTLVGVGAIITGLSFQNCYRLDTNHCDEYGNCRM